jgi:hypothetical protein
MPAETNAVVINTTETNKTEIITENTTVGNTSAPAENATENITK